MRTGARTSTTRDLSGGASRTYIMSHMSRGRAIALLLALGVFIGVGVGIVALDGRPSVSSADLKSSPGLVIPVSFAGEPGTDQMVLDQGGLTLKASCPDYPHGPTPYLTVTASTADDDAVISSSFLERRRGDAFPYTFVKSNFDRSYGPWDFLGSAAHNATGTLNYAQPGGGTIAVSFLARADKSTAGKCLFMGTATYAQP
jgi:hypothetical protein